MASEVHFKMKRKTIFFCDKPFLSFNVFSFRAYTLRPYLIRFVDLFRIIGTVQVQKFGIGFHSNVLVWIKFLFHQQPTFSHWRRDSNTRKLKLDSKGDIVQVGTLTLSYLRHKGRGINWRDVIMRTNFFWSNRRRFSLALDSQVVQHLW